MPDRGSELTQRVATRLRALAAERQVSRAEVSRKTGISQTKCNNIFRGARSPTLDELGLIAYALEVPLVDVLMGPIR